MTLSTRPPRRPGVRAAWLLAASAALAPTLLVTGTGPALATPAPVESPATPAAPAPAEAPALDPGMLIPAEGANARTALAAPAGTLVYIRAHNVWASRTDGTSPYQITRDGTEAAPYENPSMSDAGIVTAQHAGGIDVLRTTGALVKRLKPTLFTTSDCTVVVPPGPPLRPRISPDGTKVAFYQTRGINCGNGVRTETRSGTVHTTTGGFAGSIQLGPYPSWVTNSRIVLRDVALADVAQGASSAYWFRDSDVLNPDDYGFFRDVTEPAVSRNGGRVGFVLSNFHRAFLLPTNGDPRTGSPAKPQRGPGCVYASSTTTNPDTPPLVDSLSYSADGATAFLRDGANVLAIQVPMDNCAAGVVTTILRDASDPSWSAAPYSTPPKPVTSPFVDVPTTHKFFKPILWMYDSGLSAGVKTPRGLEYQPDAGMNRGAMAAFMYRSAKPTGFVPPAKSPFVDVPTTHTFYKQIAWMHATGLTAGTRTPRGLEYRPAAGMNRGAMAAFMYRSAKPTGFVPPAKSPFVDVPTTHTFYKQIAWMHATGLTAGTRTPRGLEYRPAAGMSRGAMAAFMYRAR